MNRIGKEKSRKMREKGLETRRRKREQKKAEFKNLYLPGIVSLKDASDSCGISVVTGKRFWKEIKTERDRRFMPCC